jgi:hypothetical protein
VARSDLDVAKVDTGVEHRGDEGVPQHVRMHLGDLDACKLGQAT